MFCQSAFESHHITSRFFFVNLETKFDFKCWRMYCSWICRSSQKLWLFYQVRVVFISLNAGCVDRIFSKCGMCGQVNLNVGHLDKLLLALRLNNFLKVSWIYLKTKSMRFFRMEADEYVQNGALNGLFVLGRSVGFIG